MTTQSNTHNTSNFTTPTKVPRGQRFVDGLVHALELSEQKFVRVNPDSLLVLSQGAPTTIESILNHNKWFGSPTHVERTRLLKLFRLMLADNPSEETDRDVLTQAARLFCSKLQDFSNSTMKNYNDQWAVWEDLDAVEQAKKHLGKIKSDLVGLSYEASVGIRLPVDSLTTWARNTDCPSPKTRASLARHALTIDVDPRHPNVITARSLLVVVNDILRVLGGGSLSISPSWFIANLNTMRKAGSGIKVSNGTEPLDRPAPAPGITLFDFENGVKDYFPQDGKGVNRSTLEGIIQVLEKRVARGEHYFVNQTEVEWFREDLEGLGSGGATCTAHRADIQIANSQLGSLCSTALPAGSAYRMGADSMAFLNAVIEQLKKLHAATKYPSEIALEAVRQSARDLEAARPQAPTPPHRPTSTPYLFDQKPDWKGPIPANGREISYYTLRKLAAYFQRRADHRQLMPATEAEVSEIESMFRNVALGVTNLRGDSAAMIRGINYQLGRLCCYSKPRDQQTGMEQGCDSVGLLALVASKLRLLSEHHPAAAPRY